MSMKYVLLFVESDDYVKEWEALDQMRRDEKYAEVERWFAEHADKITSGPRLQPRETATTVRLSDGEMLVTDGPFVEGNEVVAGFAEIEVADLDEALRMVKTWPACPIIEIRPAI
jgi:hypothetical protein